MTEGRDPGALERELVVAAIVRLRARILALVLGGLTGTGLFVATAWLIVRGGINRGEHLKLLGNYFPGYSVTWPGAFIGAFYGALVGACVGWAMARIYNRVATRSM